MTTLKPVVVGPALKQKAAGLAKWLVEVKTDACFVYLEYLESSLPGTKLSDAQWAALRTGVSEALMTGATLEILLGQYYAGASIEHDVKPKLYELTKKVVRKTKGLAALFKKAQMMSAAAYAASPESEAYWAS